MISMVVDENSRGSCSLAGKESRDVLQNSWGDATSARGDAKLEMHALNQPLFLGGPPF
jgi:hypothetical protein